MKETAMIRVIVVDDQNTICQMLRFSLAPQPDLEIVGIAQNGESALQQIADHRPDIALVDLAMPGMNGLELTEQICDRFSHTKVLMLSIHNQKQGVNASLQAGAKGYLLKTTPPEDLAQAIRSIHTGYFQLSPGLFEVRANRIREASPSDHSSIEPEFLEIHGGFSTATALELEADQMQSYLPHRSLRPELTLGESPQPLVSSPSGELGEWAEATQAQMNALPRVWTQALLGILIFFTVAVLPWAMFTKIDETGTARGRLEPRGKTVRLDAPVSGTVSGVNVKEGEIVKKGQDLMVLEPELAQADLQQAQAKLEGQLNRLTQLEGIKSQQEVAQRTQRLQYQAQTSEIEAQVDQINEGITSEQTSTGLAQELIAKDQQSVKQLKALRKEGAVSGVQVDQAERTMITNRELLQQSKAKIVQAQADLKIRQKQRDRIQREGELATIETNRKIKELQTQISDLKAEIAQNKKLIESLRLKLKQLQVKSPIAGTIFQLPIQHPGAVVQPSQLVAQIAPQGAQMVLRAEMPSRESGFLKVGMPVRLKFDAYPFQTYGIIPGQLSWISPNSKKRSLPPEAANDPPAENDSIPESFEIEVVLKQSYIESAGKKIVLTPGQTATAEVVVRQRRLMDFLIDPFRQLQKSGLQL
ncbi:MAG: response regulator [Thermosynechococcaceae cyanobacterium]